MSEKDEEKTQLGCFLFIAFLPALAFWNAFALRTAWGYFIEPLGAPPLGFAHAGGLMALIHLLQARFPTGKNDETPASDLMKLMVQTTAYQAAAMFSLFLWHWGMS